MTEFRGVEKEQELKKNKVHLDTRTVWQQVVDTFRDAYIAALFIVLLVGSTFFIPSLSFLIPFGALVLALIPINTDANRMLPIHLPQNVGMLDKNDPKPGQPGKFYKSRGAFMLGNLRKGRKEVWLSAQKLLTHVLLLGTTGAGKTETLVSLGSNVIAMGSGLIYVDAKAAPKLLLQIATLARMFGRDDDLRVVNYITGGQTLKGKTALRLSNTTNPFAIGSADTAVQTLTSLIPASGGDNQIFVDKAVAMISAVMPALVELRDNYNFNIYPSLINEYITLTKFVELSKDQRISPRNRNVMEAYLSSMPGYISGAKPERQPEEVGRQWGFAQSYFTRALSSLSDTYGHIYNIPLAEVDFTDIVMRARILVVLIPAMEKAGEERKALGKVILSSLRAAMALGLGNKIEGDRVDVLDALPTASNVPAMIIVDEYAEVATEGFAVTATQGRGLGFSVIFAGQDLAGFIKASEEEADMIFGNTRLKILMALEDPEKTWSRFEKLAGETWTTTTTGFHGGENGIDPFKRNQEVQMQKVSRLNIQDLKEQTEGQAHVFDKSEIHRVQIFHHGVMDDQLIENFRLNRMLQINPPSDEDAKKLIALKDSVKRISDLVKGFADGSIEHPVDEIPEGLTPIADEIANEAFVPARAYMSFCRKAYQKSLDSLDEQLDEFNDDTDSQGSNANSDIESLIGGVDTTESSEDAADASEGIDLEALLGSDDEQAGSTEPTENETDDDVDLSTFRVEPVTDDYISDVIQEAEELWITLENDDDEFNVPMPKELHDELTEINELAGIPDAVAKTEAVATVKGIADAMSYEAHEPIVEPLEDDESLLLDAIAKLESME